MEKMYIVILSGLFTIIVGMVGYWLKTVHKEFKAVIKELTDYTTQLKHLIVGIQTQIDKSIETDISELKADIKNLYSKANKNEADIASFHKK